ncbi:glucosaminidase domain-containing protein [Candidatus Saccharibacteria bacterium]|nr:glucosaminidase domain-containing protein [Candidatus Saccharibacteria bacterium]
MGRIKLTQLLRSIICFFLASLILSGIIATPASALTDLQKIIFKENNIMFWNPDEGITEECYDGKDGRPNSIPDPGTGDKWDGHCSGVSSHEDWLKTHISTIMSVAKSNGLPWEAIMAQTIQESSGGKKEVCSFNPLGLKGEPSCDGKHRSFGSYTEAFNYYVNKIIPVREAKGKFADNPYAYIYFIQHGATYKYAQSETYVNNTSALVCGIQKWAESHGYQTSSITYRNYGDDTGDSGTGGGSSIINECPDDCTYGNGQAIADKAIELAWPDNNHRNEVKPAFAEAAKSLGNNPTLSWSQDCGHFAGVVIRSSVDSEFPASGTSSMNSYLSSSPKWQKIDNTGSTSNLEPGDVFVVTAGGGSGYGHIIIYTGASGKNAAAASLNMYTGKVTNIKFSDSRGTYNIYRYIGEGENEECLEQETENQ